MTPRYLLDTNIVTEPLKPQPNQILPYDMPAANWHATERSRLTNLGLPPPFADGQVAAVAVVNHLVLVTNNGTDYANFQGLQVVNWF